MDVIFLSILCAGDTAQLEKVCMLLITLSCSLGSTMTPRLAILSASSGNKLSYAFSLSTMSTVLIFGVTGITKPIRTPASVVCTPEWRKKNHVTINPRP